MQRLKKRVVMTMLSENVVEWATGGEILPFPAASQYPVEQI
jgi:hypothetical protein